MRLLLFYFILLYLNSTCLARLARPLLVTRPYRTRPGQGGGGTHVHEGWEGPTRYFILFYLNSTCLARLACYYFILFTEGSSGRGREIVGGGA